MKLANGSREEKCSAIGSQSHQNAPVMRTPSCCHNHPNVAEYHSISLEIHSEGEGEAEEVRV